MDFRLDDPLELGFKLNNPCGFGMAPRYIPA